MAAGTSRGSVSVLPIALNPTSEFLDPSGTLPVNTVERIRRGVVDIYGTVRAAGLPVILGLDAHEESDPEFAETGLPPHGIPGTDGAKPIYELTERGAPLIPPSGRRKPWIDVQILRNQGGIVILEKTKLDLATNPALNELLRSLQPAEMVFMGALLEQDIHATTISLVPKSIKITVAETAAGFRDAELWNTKKKEMLDRGIRFESVEELMLRLNPRRGLS